MARLRYVKSREQLKAQAEAGSPKLDSTVRSIRIASFVFHHPEPGPLELNHEVEDAMWVPYSVLLHPERRVDFEVGGYHGPFEGIRVGHPERHIVWGLTRRILRSFVELLGERLP